MGIKVDGHLHDASIDALLTAKIAIRIFEDLDHGFFVDDFSKGRSNHFKIFQN